MADRIKLVILEDDACDAELIIRELRRGDIEPEWVRVETESEFRAALDSLPDVILSDSRLPDFDGLEALKIARERNPDIPFILVSGRLPEERAIDAMRHGASDYLQKDRLARLGEAVRRAIAERHLREEHAQAFERLRQTDERDRLLSELSSDYVYSLTLADDGTIACDWITGPFNRITGFDPDEINAIGWMTLYHPDDRAITALHLRSLRKGEPDSMNVRILTRDKHVRWMRVHERPIAPADASSTKIGFQRIYGAAQDITTHKNLEEQLVHSQKMEAIGRLAGGVAHDFNNLLTVICGYGELLEKSQGLSETDLEYTGEILSAARRAADLTRQLLAFSRRHATELKTIDLNTTTRGLEKLLRRLIGEDVELTIACEAEVPFVRVDPIQIQQVVFNLAVNARDAMPSGGTLAITTANVYFDKALALHEPAAADGSHVLLSIKDNGTGMDSVTAAQIFEPFFTTKEPGKGTGLGLAMVYGAVTQSGGEIRVSTQPGCGTVFNIYLRRVEPPSQQEEQQTPFELRPLMRRGTILVLEDEPSLRALVREVLSHHGYNVLDTGDPDQAIELSTQYGDSIDLFITDMVLPRMSGPQTAKRIARIVPNIRMIYTSGYPGKGKIPASLKRFGKNYLEKPFTAEALLREVRLALDSSAT